METARVVRWLAGRVRPGPRRFGAGGRRRRLAILVNIVAPYRVPVYRQLSERFETLVLLSGREANRSWSQELVGPHLTTRTAPGFTLQRRIRRGDGRTHDLRYYQFNLGPLWQLLGFRPQAVISVAMGIRSLTGLLYGRLFGAPVWVWWGGTTHTERGRSRIKHVLRRRVFAPLVPRWISYGQTSTEYLETIGVPRHRILQVQNAVDDRLYRAPVPPYPLPSDLPRPRALAVGQLLARKGIFPLLKSTAALQRGGVEFSLVVVGDGPEAAAFDACAAKLGVRHLHRIPHVPLSDMPAVYRACDLFVFPTLEDVWGLVVNEALWTGIPVIASKYAGCAMELLPAANVFDPDDGEGFVDAYRRGLTGAVAGPDLSRLWTMDDVVDAIATDVVARLPRGQRGEP